MGIFIFKYNINRFKSVDQFGEHTDDILTLNYKDIQFWPHPNIIWEVTVGLLNNWTTDDRQTPNTTNIIDTHVWLIRLIIDYLR